MTLFSQKDFIFTGRLLLTTARSPITYLHRGSLVLALLIFTAGVNTGASTSGGPLFSVLVYLNLFYISIITIQQFSAVIAGEKEQGTLGLLMITPRHPISLIAAKAVPLFVEIFASVLIELPILLICITMGGVDLNQVLLLMLFIPFHSLFLATISLHFSTITNEAKTASILTYISAGAFYSLPSIIDSLLSIFTPNLLNFKFTQILEPYNSFEVLDNIMSFEGTFLEILVYASAIVALCFITLLKSLKTLNKMDLTTTAKAQKNTKGKSSVKRKRRAWNDALVGKDFHLGGGKKTIFLKIIAYPALIFLFAYMGDILDKPETIPLMATPTLIFFFLIEFLAYSGQSFSVEYKEKQLSALLSLPYTNMQFIFKKLKGAFIFSLVPLTYFFIFCFSSQKATKNLLELICNIHIITALGLSLCLLVTVIFSGLTGKIKRTFLQQLTMAFFGGLVILIVIYPIVALYNENKYLGAVACLVACLVYCKYILHLTSTWMTRLAQQEN